MELSTATTRILIDYGLSMPRPEGAISGSPGPDRKAVDAVLVSRTGTDHRGLWAQINSGVPVYMSPGAQELIGISRIFSAHGIPPLNIRAIKNRKTFEIGDIRITPYPVDHAAFDALAFLIEAGNKRLFFSGDFRGHGRRSVLFKQMLEHPPEKIDYLIMESAHPAGEETPYPDESRAQARIEEVLGGAPGKTFLLASPLNIDRLVCAYRACLRANAMFVIDIYTAYALDKLRSSSKHIPQFNWKNVRIRFYKEQAETLGRQVSAKLLYFYSTKKIDTFTINKTKKKVLLLAGSEETFALAIRDIDNTRGSKIICSVPPQEITGTFREYCARKGLEIEPVNTAGRASGEDIKAFVDALKPAAVVPLDTCF